MGRQGCWRGTSRSLAAIAVMAMVATACGGAPPTGGGGDGDGDAAGSDGRADNTEALQEVYDEVDGTSGDERRDALLKLAEGENVLNVYSSTNLDDAQPLLDGFEEVTEIEVNYYRASSADVLRRVLQEADAGYPGNDVVLLNGPEMMVLDNEGLLAPLESPYKKDILEAARFDNWTGVYLNSFITAWNTDEVSADEAPSTWEDVLQNFEGDLAMELGDFDWFATLTNGYFADQGMSEDEVVEMFKKSASNARVIDGHTLMAELMVAGEYSIATSLYHHRINQFQAEGAPVGWEDPAPVEPIIIRPNGIAIMKHVQSPASAALFIDFLISDAQEILAEQFRGPASTKVEGGVSPDYETELVDLEAVTDERAKWEDLWAEIVESSGSEVTE